MSQSIPGMANIAWAAFCFASKRASIDTESHDNKRIVQTVGDAAASAGFHHADGTLDGAPYTAAVDCSVRDLNGTQIATWIEELCRVGFAPYYRNWPDNFHVHAVFAGVPMKPELDGQMADFFAGRDGLAGHRRADDEWWYPSIELRKIPESIYRISNPKTGAGQCQQAPLMLAATLPKPPVPSLPLYLGDSKQPCLMLAMLDGVALAPARRFGEALGFNVAYDPKKNEVSYDGDEIPLAVKLIGGNGYVPIRDLAREVGLKVDFDRQAFKVTVHH